MAKNYSISEAVEIIVVGQDAEQITELGRRYPLLATKIAKVGAKAGEDFIDLMSGMPDNLSANKVNQCIRKALEESGEDEEFEEEDGGEDETPAPKKAEKKAPAKPAKAASSDGDDSDYDNWNNAKMYKKLGDMGARKDCKEKFGDLSHDSMLKYLKKYGGKAATEEAEDEDAEEEAPAENDYESMKAMDLFKLCKERKIKVEPKKPAKYYIDLLKKADEAATEAEDDEDWDEEDDDAEEEAPAPAPKKAAPAKKEAAKPAPKAPAKPAKKAKEEDDEDWDI